MVVPSPSIFEYLGVVTKAGLSCLVHESHLSSVSCCKSCVPLMGFQSCWLGLLKDWYYDGLINPPSCFDPSKSSFNWQLSVCFQLMLAHFWGLLPHHGFSLQHQLYSQGILCCLYYRSFAVLNHCCASATSLLLYSVVVLLLGFVHGCQTKSVEADYYWMDSVAFWPVAHRLIPALSKHLWPEPAPRSV